MSNYGLANFVFKNYVHMHILSSSIRIDCIGSETYHIYTQIGESSMIHGNIVLGLFPTFILWSVSDQVCGFPLSCFAGIETPATAVQTSVLILCNSSNKRLLNH